MEKPRILLWDIETTHNLIAAFRLYGEDYHPHTNLVKERYIVSASWKWLGEKQVHAVATTDFEDIYAKDPHNDKGVVTKLWEVLSEADVIVAHNGDKYDIKFFKGRAIFHGLAPLPPIVSIDTLKVAKKEFMFNSNKLDYLGKFLGVGRKIETHGSLWMKILIGSDVERRQAIKEMVRYNKQDVLLLEDVFKKLQPYVQLQLNRAGMGALTCPRPWCGSTHIQSRGVHHAVTRDYQRFQCQKCQGWFRKDKALPTSNGHRVL